MLVQIRLSYWLLAHDLTCKMPTRGLNVPPLYLGCRTIWVYEKSDLIFVGNNFAQQTPTALRKFLGHA